MLGADGPLREMTPRSALEDRQAEKQQVTDTENTAYGAWAGDVGRGRGAGAPAAKVGEAQPRGVGSQVRRSHRAASAQLLLIPDPKSLAFIQVTTNKCLNNLPREDERGKNMPLSGSK